jgi:hypothetical protein
MPSGHHAGAASSSGGREVLSGGTGESPRWQVGELWGQERQQDHVFRRQKRRNLRGRKAAIVTIVAIVVAVTALIVGLETADAAAPPASAPAVHVLQRPHLAAGGGVPIVPGTHSPPDRAGSVIRTAAP